MQFHVITLFPEVCKAYTDASVLGRAQKTEKGKGAKVRGKKITVTYYNPRDFTKDKHRKVDERPYGGGPGMVLMAEPIVAAWKKAVGLKKDRSKIKTYIMSPRGRVFNQVMATELSLKYEHIVLISGRYEGVDARVKEITGAEELSIGDFTLTGGELPALTMIDAISRHIPGVLGTQESLEEARETNGASYTRPETLQYKGKEYPVPKVLLEGNHAKIELWRKKGSQT